MIYPTSNMIKQVFLVVGIIGFLYSGWCLYSFGYERGKAKVQADWDKETLVLTQAHNKALADAAKKQADLQTAADNLRKELSDEKAAADKRESDLLGELRKRPKERATPQTGGVPEATAPGTGCTGLGLARPDGEFLARYAARARDLNLALKECVTKYEELAR